MFTRSKARLAQPASQVTSSRVNHSPRRILQSRQGSAGVIINPGAGSPSFIMAVGRVFEPFTISRCADRRCKTCPKLNCSKNIKCSVTNRTFEVINPSGENLNCHSQNLIYLLNCYFCFTQYVGETVTPLHIRMNGHRTSKEGCEHIINHSKHSCEGHNFTCQILEKLPGSGYDINGEVDENMTERRLERENFWILKFRTLFPYGLNEKLSGKLSNSSKVETAVGRFYPPIPRNGIRPIRSRKQGNNREIIKTTQDFFCEINDILKNKLSEAFNQIRIILNNTKKGLLKEIAYAIHNRDEGIQFLNNREQFYLYILDVIDTKFLKPENKENTKRVPKNVCVIDFVNKGVEDIHIGSIFRLPDVISMLPNSLQTDDNVPVPTMRLTNTIRSKILNYKETVKSLSIEVDEDVSFIRNQYECSCENSEFCDPHHKHIVTGDLRFIQNAKLRKLFSKGPNYREKPTTNFKKCKEAIQSALSNTIENMSTNYNIHKDEFNNWYNLVMSKVNDRIKYLQKKLKRKPTTQVLQDENCLRHLEELHKNYVIVPIDKASNNVAIICKKFYIHRLLNEVGLFSNGSNTYILSNKSESDIINNNLQYSEKLGFKTLEINKTLPIMYWMPKMHYTPSRARFIVASAHCSTKPISQVASKLYKKIFQQIQSFHNKSYFYKNYNKFWVVQNSFPVIEKLESINTKKKAKSVSTYDFSTLYTNLPHDDLVKVLDSTVDFAFNGGKKTKSGNRKYLTVRGKSVSWTQKKYGFNSYTSSQIKQITHHLIKDCYFTIGNLLFLQAIGIPMGIDPAPFWANLYLHHYESFYISKLIKDDKIKALKFKNASRFIDDECNLNDGGEFAKSFENIYPKELKLKCEHQGSHATFLDLDIEIKDGVFHYKLFDKRDNFNFFIVRMPDLSSNIPSYIFYGSILSEVLRIARCTLNYCDFRPKLQALFKRMMNQGASLNKLLKQIRKTFNKHPSAFTSFNITSDEIINNILNNI